MLSTITRNIHASNLKTGLELLEPVIHHAVLGHVHSLVERPAPKVIQFRLEAEEPLQVPPVDLGPLFGRLQPMMMQLAAGLTRTHHLGEPVAQVKLTRNLRHCPSYGGVQRHRLGLVPHAPRRRRLLQVLHTAHTHKHFLPLGNLPLAHVLFDLLGQGTRLPPSHLPLLLVKLFQPHLHQRRVRHLLEESLHVPPALLRT
mmetsp:Transcript_12/g.38  ORF Transcript_12/g.38 Transcript_12/m.38 type:complete len:200 (-) Transcript_12:188-787(-)